MAKAIMIQGTGSGVGKSLIVAGLCRLFSDRGINVAPFKAQNMALNSFITKDGGEIGRAQAFQAEAARIEPTTDMNPILLKATGEAGCQVIINGRVHSNMQAQEYYAFKKTAWAAVAEAYERLSARHEFIIIEGAGSPAEINLADDEVVNMRMARHAQAPVILVGDIDKGGVFASLFGTVALLNGDAEYIKAFIINKFRGDMAILQPGLDMIQERTGRPVIGVLPYLRDIRIHEEDGMALDRFHPRSNARPIKIVVLRLKYISNFTDFDPFLYEPDVDLLYSLRDTDIENADMVIIPGSKNTVKDLMLLREAGIEDSIKRAAARGVQVVGICGGYQMLGKKLHDPYGVESKHREVEGIGLLNVETTFDKTKTTCQTEIVKISACEWWNKFDGYGDVLNGYEIHMGKTTGDVGLFSMRRIYPQAGIVTDGSINKNVWGSYIHGIFDNDRFRRTIINSLRRKHGCNPLGIITDYKGERNKSIDQVAEIIRKHIDLYFIDSLVKQ